MNLGIFAKTFLRESVDDTLDAVLDHGLGTVQFNLSCAGLQTLPEEIDTATADEIRHSFASRQIAMAAISGTFNLIDPNVENRRTGLRRLGVLAAMCPRLGTSVVTLCTGTRDPTDMWRYHPDNGSDEAWGELTQSVNEALITTAESGVTLAIEPEVNNVVNSARKARRLLDEMRSPRLKIIIDPANLFHADELSRMHEVLAAAFDLLGPDIVLAHAKDVIEADGQLAHVAAGKGCLDYRHYAACLRRVGFQGALILHGLAESEVNGSVAFLRQILDDNNIDPTNGG